MILAFNNKFYLYDLLSKSNKAEQIHDLSHN